MAFDLCDYFQNHGQKLVAAALREGFFGNASEARHTAMAALELSKGLYVEFGAALALEEQE